MPKEEGGLGVRYLRKVSKVFALKLLWKLNSDANSLWVSWIRKHILHGSSFWKARPSTQRSWVWRPSGPRALGVLLHAIVVDAYVDSHWHIRSRLHPTLLAILDSLYDAQVPTSEGGPDIPLWRHALDDFRPSFSSPRT